MFINQRGTSLPPQNHLASPPSAPHSDSGSHLHFQFNSDDEDVLCHRLGHSSLHLKLMMMLTSPTVLLLADALLIWFYLLQRRHAAGCHIARKNEKEEGLNPCMCKLKRAMHA